MARPVATKSFEIVCALYLAVATLILTPLHFFGNAYFGVGFGGTLEIIRDEISYFSPMSWLTFVGPPLLFVGYCAFLWLRGMGRSSFLILICGSLSIVMAATILLYRADDPLWAGDYLRGAYHTEDGRVLVINSSPVAALDVWLSDGTRAMTWTGDKLNYSGTSCIGQEVSNDDFFVTTENPQGPVVKVKMRNEPWQQAKRMNLKETPVKFGPDGKLAGLLVEPAVPHAVPLVVFPEGPTTVSTLENEFEHHLLAGLGFAVFIYDARGVNQSGGRRSKNRERAVLDAVSAIDAARAAMGSKASQTGLYGGSFALHVAARTAVDFAVIVAPSKIGIGGNQVKTRWLFVIPGADKEAPARPLLKELRSYQAAGQPIDLVVYPRTQFSIIRSELRNGKLCQAGKATSFYRVLKKWIDGGTVPHEPDLVHFGPSIRPPA